MRGWRALGAVALVASGLPSAAQPVPPVDGLIPAFSTARLGEPPAAWRFTSLPGKIATQFHVVDLAGARVLQVQSDLSFGNLVHALHAHLSATASLTWRWRVDRPLVDADLRQRSGDDAAAKLCVFFGIDAHGLPLAERLKLALAHTLTGEDIPAQTLCYVWDNRLPVETLLHSPFTHRIRYLVLQSGSTALGEWRLQRRELLADHQRAFGDEAGAQVPEVLGVAVCADADNTHGHGLSYFGDIALSP